MNMQYFYRSIKSSGRNKRAASSLKHTRSFSSFNPATNALNPQGSIGNRALGKLLQLKSLQARFKISGSGDQSEQEANKVADDVMNKPQQHKNQQAQAAENSKPASSELTGIAAIDTGGQPLSKSDLEYFEPRFKADFHDVRIHADSEAAETAQSVQARAFTLGRNIVFERGEYAPDSNEGRKLLAHELAHVVQQSGSQPVFQCKPKKGATSVNLDVFQRFMFFLWNPGLANGAIKTALQELHATYQPQVKIGDIDFRKKTSEKEEGLGGFATCAKSYWEGKTPVIEIAGCGIKEYEKYEADPVGNVHNGHNFIRMVGHEMYHLYRSKLNEPKNPLQPLFEKEYQKRMARVRKDWVSDLQSKQPGIKSWAHVPRSQQEQIEKGAASTSEFQGLYFRTAYLVEEIYTKIEELSFLRIEQRLEKGVQKETQAAVSELADLVFKIWNRLDSIARQGGEFVTPKLLVTTKTEMESYLKKRYKRKDGSDPYELRFFKRAIKDGMTPI